MSTFLEIYAILGAVIGGYVSLLIFHTEGGMRLPLGETVKVAALFLAFVVIWPVIVAAYAIEFRRNYLASKRSEASAEQAEGEA